LSASVAANTQNVRHKVGVTTHGKQG